MRHYEIRTMIREELDLALEWAAREGWNPGLSDAECFRTADPNGFLIGLLDDEPIAAISVVRYGAAFGFLGLYIVKPEYRGQGYGLSIWNAGLDHLKGRNVGLDGVVAQQANYIKSGFELAYRNIRYQGTGSGGCRGRDDMAELDQLPFAAVREYDQALFPGERSKFIERWITQPNAVGLAIHDNGTLRGYGVLRACRSGYKIGPLFADTPSQADALLQALLSSADENAPVYFDTPEVNKVAVQLAESYGMNPVFETARMYTDGQPKLPMHKVYGLTTFELG